MNYHDMDKTSGHHNNQSGFAQLSSQLVVIIISSQINVRLATQQVLTLKQGRNGPDKKNTANAQPVAE